MERSRRDRNIQIVNFGLAPLTKSVECSAVCADHCQPANLISPDFWRRRPGFRVEHFIRPPLHLTFHFLVPINIACVLIKPDLIESARTNITVWASSSIHPEPHQQQMVLCGRGTVSGEGAVLAFWNKSFERRHQEVDLSSVSNVAGSHMSNWDLEKFSKEPMKEIYNVRRLKLSINYFSGPKPVALKQVEVWGTLGGCCSGEKKRAAQAAIAELRTSANMGLYTNCSSRLCQGVMSRPWTSAAPETFSTGDRGAVESAHNVPKHDIKHRPGEEHKSINSCTSVKRTLLHSRTGKAMDGEAPEPPVILEGPQASSTHPSAQFGGHLSLQCSPHPQCCSLQPKGTCCCSDEEHSKSPADLCRCSWPLEGCGAGIDVMTAVGRSRSEPPYASTVSASGSGSTDVLGQNSREEDHSIWDTSPIPEQFLDEITFELMLLPMLLPSGHFVDQSTLERLAHTDSTYGRPPSDPFTGVLFRDNLQPQFSVELKQQIDNFVTQNKTTLDQQSSSLGQTLGSAREIALHLATAKGKNKKRSRDDLVSSPRTSCPLPSKKQCAATLTEANETKDIPGSSFKDGPSANSTTSKPAEPPHNRILSHAHEVEVASSLDRELYNLFHC